MTAPSLPSGKSTLDWARFYHALGWSVIPVRPGEKVPAVAWAPFQKVRADMAQLDDWFTVGGYGLGIVTGAVSGLFVLDFDGEAGQEQLAELERTHGALPSTPCALTPGGGLHVLFQHPGRPVPTRKGVLPGLDVRGDGGYIVVHPSRHPRGGTYHWDADAHPEDVAIAAAPDWVLALCVDPAASATTVPPISPSISHVARPGPLGLPSILLGDGREAYMRDTVLAVLRAQRDRLGRLPTAEELFDEVWPQYSRKVDLSRPGRGADEVMAKIRYTLRRVEAGAVRGLPPTPPATTANTDPSGPMTPAAGAPAGWSPTPTSDADPFPTLDIAALSAMPPVSWLIDKLITADGFGITYGPPASLKSFLLIAWSLHVASGRPWLGRTVRQGSVLYVAGEGVRGIGRRVRAWMRHHGLDGVDLPFRLLPASVNLTDPIQLTRLVRTAMATAEAEGSPVVLVVIDTVARAIPGADENSAQDMGRLVAAIEHLKTEVACHVHGVHHSGKDPERGARGSSALLGAVDTMIRITRDEDRVTLTNEKQKDDDEAPPITLQVERVDLSQGLTVEGSLVLVEAQDTTLVPHPAPAQPRTTAPAPSSPEPAAEDLERLRLEIAALVGAGGTMTQSRLAKALGWSRGRSYGLLNIAVPLAPAAADVTLDGTPVRLQRVRSGTSATSPVEVRCAAI